MIAHVAQAVESKGCVVMRALGAPAPHDIALVAAVRVAQAFESRIEGLVVRDQRLIDLASYAGARQLSNDGRTYTDLTSTGLGQETHFAYLELRRRLHAVAEDSGIPVSLKVVQGDPIDTLAQACAASGPWNVISIAEPFHSKSGRAIEDVFASVRDATGLVLVGPNAQRVKGRIALIVEDIEQLSAMTRAARVLSPFVGRGIDLMIVAHEPDRLHWLEGEARRFVAEYPAVRFEIMTLSTSAPCEVAEALRRLEPGFVLARFGGVAVPCDDLGPLAAGLGCPLLLMR